jgi:hypothetical protein
MIDFDGSPTGEDKDTVIAVNGKEFLFSEQSMEYLGTLNDIVNILQREY